MTTNHLGTTVLSTEQCLDMSAARRWGGSPSRSATTRTSSRSTAWWTRWYRVPDHQGHQARGVRPRARRAFGIDGIDPDVGRPERHRQGPRRRDRADAPCRRRLDLPLFPWHASPKNRRADRTGRGQGRRFHVVGRRRVRTPSGSYHEAGAADRPARLPADLHVPRTARHAPRRTGRRRWADAGRRPGQLPPDRRDIPFRTTPAVGRPAQPGTCAFEVDMFDERTHSGWSVIAAARCTRGPRYRVRAGRIVGSRAS